MKSILQSRVRSSFAILAGVVDLFSIIQIINQTSLKMPEILTNAWFWLFVIVTATSLIMFAYFKVKDYLEGEVAYKKGIEEYRRRISDEFNKRMAEESKLHERCNKLGWEIDSIRRENDKLKKEIEQLKLSMPVGYYN